MPGFAVIDQKVRRYVDPALIRMAESLNHHNITANQVSVLGFAVGIGGSVLLSQKYFICALICLVINRLGDGIDGALARLIGPSDQGAFLDIVLDFIFYGAFVLGATIAFPDQAVPGAFLLFSFIANGSTFLAFSIFAEKLGIRQAEGQSRGIHYLGGLAEGFETVVAFTLVCLFPDWFWLVAVIFGLMCCISAAYRLYYGYRVLSKRIQ